MCATTKPILNYEKDIFGFNFEPIFLVKVNLWLGGNDLAEEGRHVWFSTGKRFSFTNWSKGNPDNHNNGDCVNMWDVTDFEWNDAACNYTIGFICEENPFSVAARRDFEIKKNFIEQVLSLK